MIPLTDRQADLCHTALETLDRVLDDRPDKLHEELSDAMRSLVELRNDVIENWEDGGRSEGEARVPLDRINAVLSIVTGAEYPVFGVRWSRMRKARDRLSELLSDHDPERVAEADGNRTHHPR